MKIHYAAKHLFYIPDSSSAWRFFVSMFDVVNVCIFVFECFTSLCPLKLSKRFRRSPVRRLSTFSKDCSWETTGPISSSFICILRQSGKESLHILNRSHDHAGRNANVKTVKTVFLKNLLGVSMSYTCRILDSSATGLHKDGPRLSEI